MPTKQENIQNMNLYPNDVLEKLHIVAKTILIPGKGQLINVDFAGMVQYAHELADEFFPDWTDRGKSDFGEFLVELMALFSDKDFFYINLHSNEGFLTRAERYRNLVHKAFSNGYKPTGLISAAGSFTVGFDAGPEELVPRGAIEFGLTNLPGMSFSNDEFTMPTTATPSSTEVTFRHGVYKSFNGYFNGKTILLTDTQIAEGSIRLIIDGEEWTESQSFYNGTAATKHFLVFYNEKAQAEIMFARENFGARPVFGAAIEASYRTGGGEIGNLEAQTLNLLAKQDTVRTLISVEQTSPTAGGVSVLSKEVLRQRAINYQRTLGNIVTMDDPKRVALDSGAVHNAESTSVGNYIYLYVIPKVNGLQGQALLTFVYDFAVARVLMNYALFVQEPARVRFTAVLDVYVLPGTDSIGAEQLVREIVAEYTDPQQNAPFGEGIKRLTLNRLIMSRVQNAQNVDYQVLYSGPTVANPPAPADINIAPVSIMDFDTSDLTVNIIGGA